MKIPVKYARPLIVASDGFSKRIFYQILLTSGVSFERDSKISFCRNTVEVLVLL